MHEGVEIERGLRKRDPEVLDRLIEQYQHRLFRYLVFFTRDRHLAEDLFQDTWIRVLERGRQYSSRYKFETWLLSIARNLAIDHMRRKSMISFSELETDHDEESRAFDVPDTESTTVYERILQQEEAAGVGTALEHLPVLYREVLVLRFHQDMALDEIAGVIGTPLSTVKSRLHRGLDMMQKRLEGLRSARQAQSRPGGAE